MRVKKYFVLKNIREDAGFGELGEEIFSAEKKKNTIESFWRSYQNSFHSQLDSL